MASRLEIAKQYLELQQERKTDEAVALLADDVVLTNPMTGAITGKTALEQQMRNPAMDGNMQLTWSEPEADGDGVKIVASGSPFGTIQVVVGFNAADQISTIDIGLA